jgi:hypothetical protein
MVGYHYTQSCHFFGISDNVWDRTIRYFRISTRFHQTKLIRGSAKQVWPDVDNITVCDRNRVLCEADP